VIQNPYLWDRITTKSKLVFAVGTPSHNTNEVGFCSSPAHRQNDRHIQNERQTDLKGNSTLKNIWLKMIYLTFFNLPCPATAATATTATA